jgi:diguanylate cyclase (GGDEF)-like protein
MGKQKGKQKGKPLRIPVPAVEREQRQEGLDRERKRAEGGNLRNVDIAERLTREMAVIAEIGRVIGSSLDIESVYEQFAAEVRKLIPFDRLSVNLHNLREGTARVAYVSGCADVVGRRKGDSYPLKGTLSEHVVRMRTGFLIHPENMKEMSIRFPSHSVSARAGMRSLLSVPLIARDEVIGGLHFRSRRPDVYGEEDLRLAERIGEQIAGAIANAQLYEEIQRLSVTDHLTGLFNRRGFFQLADREFERALRFGRPLAALMLDIDHFKGVNDTRGHAAGDQVLRALAGCFLQNTRGIDVAGRYGGEEFILLMPETKFPGAIRMAERLRRSMADLSVPVCSVRNALPTEVRVTVSIGVALLRPDVPTLDDLIGRTDQALYRAKGSGRDRVAVWEEADGIIP